MIDWTDPAARERYLPKAKDPTPEEVAKAEKDAWEAQTRLKQALGDYRPARWRLAEECWKCRDVHAWLWIQRPSISKKEWLADPEISMSEDRFDYYARAWDLVRLSGLLANDSRYAESFRVLAMSRVVMVLRGLGRVVVTLEQAMNEAETWHWADLRDKYVRGIRDEHLDPPPAAEGGVEDREVGLSDLDKAIEEHLDAVEDAQDVWRETLEREPRLQPFDVEKQVGELLIQRHLEEAGEIRRQLIAERTLLTG